jgi:hypothetical protein
MLTTSSNHKSFALLKGYTLAHFACRDVELAPNMDSPFQEQHVVDPILEQRYLTLHF